MANGGYPQDLQSVALYLRKSRADLDAEARGEGETLSKHRRALFEMAKEYRYSVAEIYEEIVSGDRIIARPEMQRLLCGVETGQFSAVLCMDLDRLGRGNMLDQGLIQQCFKESGTLIITPRKVYDLRDEMDEEWSEFESFMARRELKIITRRMQRGRRQSAKEGRSISKKPPYGYVRDENNRLSPDPNTAPVVKMIFQWHAEGLGITKIAHQLQDIGAPHPTSHPMWEKATIRDILNNKAYLGHILWGRFKYFKDSKTGKARRILLPPEQWIIAENAHEPIISQDLWNKADQMGKKLTPHVTYDYTLKNPLAGLVKCPECGKTMVRRRRANRPNDNFLCPSYKCNTKASLFNLVEQQVIEQLNKICDELPRQSHKVNITSESNKLNLLKRKQTALEGELLTLDKQKSKLHDLLEQGVYDINTFVERNRMIGDGIERVTKELHSCNKEIEQIHISKHRQSEMVPAIAKAVEEYLATDHPETKNKILKSVLSRVIYHRKKDWPRNRDFELELYLRI